MVPPIAPLNALSDELLVRCHERASRYDRDHAFFREDFDELSAAGYLRLPVPVHAGGAGMSLGAVMREQRRLGYFAAPTALALSTHLAWVGTAADRCREGDRSLGWVVDEASRDRVFGVAVAEPAGDDGVLASTTTRAERVHGGYRFTGHKTGSSLTPVWDFLGIFGIDPDAAGGPCRVHAFMARHTEGYVTRVAGASLGMRARGDDDTLLDCAFVPDRYVARVVTCSGAGGDSLSATLFTWLLLGAANVALGMAQRALDLATDTRTRARAAANRNRDGVRRTADDEVAEMTRALAAIDAHIAEVTRAWERREHDWRRWPEAVLVANRHAILGAWHVTDTALDAVADAGSSSRQEMERLFRDARAARLQMRGLHRACRAATASSSAREPRLSTPTS